MNNTKKPSKGLVAAHAVIGIVFTIYIIICMLKNFENFDGVVFALYFMTILSSKDFLKNNIIKYTFYITIVLLLIFLIHTVYNFII